jgi:hypothetical protein
MLGTSRESVAVVRFPCEVAGSNRRKYVRSAACCGSLPGFGLGAVFAFASAASRS